MSGGRRHGVTEAMAACNEIEAGVARIRELLKDADAYGRRAFYEFTQSVYEDMMLALERAWLGFADLLEELPE